MLETKTKDDEINELIEEEHATDSKRKVNVQYAAPQQQEFVTKKNER